jgi:type IV pilus assembly protein PilQ
VKLNAIVFAAASLAALHIGSGVHAWAEVNVAEVEEVVQVEDVAFLPAGDNVSLNVEGVDITSILRLLSDTRHVNIVAGPEVSGRVSVNLYDVPFKEALDSILGAAGFVAFEKGDIIYVTTEDGKKDLPHGAQDLETRIYDIRYGEPDKVLETVNSFMSSSGTATLVGRRKLIVKDAPHYLADIDSLVEAADVPPQKARAFEINHALPEDIQETISQSLSSTGTVTLVPNRRLVIQDTPEHLEMLADLIAQLDTPPRQVLISGKILSITRDDDLELGTELRSSTIRFEDSPYLDDRPRTAGMGGSVNRAFPSDFDRWLDDVTSLSSGAAGIATAVIRDHEQLFVDALSSVTEVETLASPQLLTVDGETAHIQVGERLGFRVTTTTETSTLESVEFLDVGTVLEVTPSIGADELIRMEVNPKVSTGAISPEGLPEERTAEATTTMIVRNGETIVIAGLLNLTKRRTKSQVPLLGDIPVVGRLFGRNTWLDRNNELIILITPYLAGPQALNSMEDDIASVGDSEQELSEKKSDLDRFFEDVPIPLRRNPFKKKPSGEATPATDLLDGEARK